MLSNFVLPQTLYLSKRRITKGVTLTNRSQTTHGLTLTMRPL